jgi:hypothetical protein
MALVTKTTRSRAIFEQYLQSEATKKTYSYNIDRFVEYNGLESWESILELDAKNLTEMMEDFVIMFKTSGKSHGAPIIPSMKDSIERVTKDEELREYFWEKLRPKFL